MNEVEKQYPVQTSSTFVKGVFIGGLLGAAAALLFAPKPGRELRGDISEKFVEASDKTKEVAGNVTDRTKEIATTVADQTSQVAGLVSDSAVSLAQTVSTKAKDVARSITENKETVSNSLADAAQSVFFTTKEAYTPR